MPRLAPARSWLRGAGQAGRNRAAGEKFARAGSTTAFGLQFGDAERAATGGDRQFVAVRGDHLSRLTSNGFVRPRGSPEDQPLALQVGVRVGPRVQPPD